MTNQTWGTLLNTDKENFPDADYVGCRGGFNTFQISSGYYCRVSIGVHHGWKKFQISTTTVGGVSAYDVRAELRAKLINLYPCYEEIKG